MEPFLLGVLVLLIVVLALQLVLPAGATSIRATEGQPADSAATASVLTKKQPFSPSASGLRNRRGGRAGAHHAAGVEKENQHPDPAVSPQSARARAASSSGNAEHSRDADVLAMWERSVRDLFAALADEEGMHNFGLNVTASKNGVLPTITLPPPQDATLKRPEASGRTPHPTLNGSEAKQKAPADGSMCLSAVNGQPVSGCSTQEITDMLAGRRLLLRLEIVHVAGAGQHKERRLVWCRRVQTLQKVKSRLDLFLSSRTLPASEPVGGQGLEFLREGLQHLLQALDRNFDTSGAVVGGGMGEEEDRRVAKLLQDVSNQLDAQVMGKSDGVKCVTMAQHLCTTVCRALMPPAHTSPLASLAATPRPSLPATPRLTGAHGEPTAGGDSKALVEITRLQQEVKQLQHELSRQKQLLCKAQAEAEGASPSNNSLSAAVAVVEENGAARAKAVQKQLQQVEGELQQERSDCQHFRDLCGQLRHEKETLEQRLQEEESTRARLEHACAAAESAADKIRSEIVRQDKERVATRASESSTDSAEKMVESLREQLRSASDDTARTIAVCAAAVEGEKARAAEVLVLQTRVTELELAQQQHVTLQTAGLGAGGGIGDEDSVLSRYNVLLRHAQALASSQEDTVARFNLLLHAARAELANKEEELSRTEEDYNLLLQEHKQLQQPRGTQALEAASPLHTAQAGMAPMLGAPQKMWVIRHGERLDEVDDSWQATTDRPYDPPLTAKGRGQAFARGQALARAGAVGAGGCVVACSPFLRCIQTGAEVLKGMSQVYEQTEESRAPQVLVVDVGLGEMQTPKQMKQCVPKYLSKDELEALDPSLRQILHQWVGQHDEASGEDPPPFPETQEIAVARYRRAFPRLLARFPGANLVCVTHGDAVATFLATSGFTSSKDNVYDTPHCCFVAATAEIPKQAASPDARSQHVAWTRGEIDETIGYGDFD